MKVSMVEINKEASSIVNQVSKTGESAVIYKHGKPIAEIRALTGSDSSERDIAYQNLMCLQPTRVDTPIAEVNAMGRQRGV